MTGGGPVRLLPAQDEDFAALLAGHAPHMLRLPAGPIADDATVAMLRALAVTIRPAFAPAAWLIIRDDEVAGLCSLVRPPESGGIDIGYGIAPTRRRRGLAVAAVAALLGWARSDARVTIVRAETSVANVPSQRVLMRNGFAQTGTRIDDEDGALLCWATRTR